MKISLIAALTQNRVIGQNNKLPWHLPDDMNYFMRTTWGHTVIMGRRNYDSLPKKYKPLPGRTNVVITRQMDLVAVGCNIVHSMQEAVQIAEEKNEHELFVIGGAEIYEQVLPLADLLYLTEIQTTLEGDRFFPKVEPSQWNEISRVPHAIDAHHKFAFDYVVYQRIVR